MKRNKIYVKIHDCIRYVEQNSTNLLDEQNEILPIGSFPPLFYKITEEVFDGRSCNYDIIKDDINHILIRFKCRFNNEYRIDLLKDPNNVYHIGFSKYENDIDDPKNYEKETEDNNSVDVLSRIVWILKDLSRNYDYCIGITGNDKKDNTYMYMMQFVSNWEKKKTDFYPTKWGIFFNI